MMTPVSGAGLKDRLLWLRTTAGLNIQQVADMVGLTRGAISLLESGDRVDIRATSAIGIARAYGVTVEWLVVGGPYPAAKRVLAAVKHARAPRMAPTGTDG